MAFRTMMQVRSVREIPRKISRKTLLQMQKTECAFLTGYFAVYAGTQCGAAKSAQNYRSSNSDSETKRD
jgi:hypothetical protein